VDVESIEWVGNTEEVITTGTVECPESVLEREEISDRIREAIAELPEKCRETFRQLSVVSKVRNWFREASYNRRKLAYSLLM